MRFGAIFTAWGNSLQSFMTVLPLLYLSCLFLFLCFSVTQLAFYTKCLSEWQQLCTYPSSSNQWKGVWKGMKVMACCKMSGSPDIVWADKRQQEMQFMEKPVIYVRTFYTWMNLLGCWQDHNLTIKEDNGGNDVIALGLNAANDQKFSSLVSWNLFRNVNKLL